MPDMKHAISTIALSLIIAAGCSAKDFGTVTAMEPERPSQERLDRAIADAYKAWGQKPYWPIEIKYERLNDCATSKRTSVMAVTNSQAFPTWIIFDDGTRQDTGTGWRYTVTLNSACNWNVPNDYYNLDVIMQHEVGHVLIGVQYHSKDKKNIMFWKVSPGRTVTDDDRLIVKRLTKPDSKTVSVAWAISGKR